VQLDINKALNSKLGMNYDKEVEHRLSWTKSCQEENSEFCITRPCGNCYEKILLSMNSISVGRFKDIVRLTDFDIQDAIKMPTVIIV
jgi:hypothetical protein